MARGLQEMFLHKTWGHLPLGTICLVDERIFPLFAGHFDGEELGGGGKKPLLESTGLSCWTKRTERQEVGGKKKK